MKKTTKPTPTMTVTTPDTLMPFLMKSLNGKSRNNIKSMMTRGDIRVNGKVKKRFDVTLRAGDVVTIEENKPDFFQVHPDLNLLYEDDDLIVIAKPEGLLSVATEKVKDNTAYHHVTDYVKLKNRQNRVFIVHRLDRDTSGILVFAKNQSMKFALQERWNELVTLRGYTAVVEGPMEKQTDTITSYLRQTKSHFVFSAKKDGDGQKAVTCYEVLAQNEQCALLSIQLQTGRKNQIRVHLSEAGHPIVGDKKYGATTNPLKRLCLHAGQLDFCHPVTGKEFSFTVPMPKKFRALVKQKPLSAN